MFAGRHGVREVQETDYHLHPDSSVFKSSPEVRINVPSPPLPTPSNVDEAILLGDLQSGDATS
jgi:hypothetical protein